MVIVTNTQNIVVPEYLNEQFFVSTLEEGLLETKVNLHEIKFEWGSNPGDNYCSTIFRVLVSYTHWHNGVESDKEEKRSLIVKTIPITPETSFLEDSKAYLKEKLIYVNVLPRLEVLTKGAKFGADYFYAMPSPVQTIVLNDLKQLGFSVASRQQGLDWAHASLILQQLGKFHAASMVLAQKDPGIVKHFTKGMLCAELILKTDTMEKMFGGFLKSLIKTVVKWPGYERIAAHLQRYSNNFRKVCIDAGLPRADDRYVVLNHGDMWTNNFMYAYDDDTQPELPTRAIFVDFQICFYGSPACDLNFFLNTSPKLEVLQHRREDLIKVYYSAFRDTLEHARFEQIPSYEDLLWELRSRETYGLFALFAFLPMITMPKELSEDNSIATLSDENLIIKKHEAIFAQKPLNDYHKWCLKRAEQLGVFGDY